MNNEIINETNAEAETQRDRIRRLLKNKRASHVNEWAKSYVRNGWALTTIPNGGKAPNQKGWNKKQNAFTTEDDVDLQNFNGIGLCHAFSGTAAIDIDDWDRAKQLLNDNDIDLDELYYRDDAVQIISGKENRGKLIYHLPNPEDPLPLVQLSGEDNRIIIEFRCAAHDTEKTVQDVLPPTIHPDTKKTYEWRGDWQSLPVLPEALHTLWLKEHAKKSCTQINRSNDNRSADGPIQKFNEENSIEDLLTRNGYKKQGSRFFAPDSSSNQPGVVIYENKTGKHLAYSHHGSDQLADNHAHDAFSIYTKLECGDDLNAALQSIGLSQSKKNSKSQNDENQRINHVKLAEELAHEIWDNKIINTNSGFYAWNNSFWGRLDDREINQKIQEALKQRFTQFKINDIREVEKMVGNTFYNKIIGWNQGPSEMINCKNGSLFFENNGWTLQDPDPDHLCTIQIPVEWDPTSKAPRFEDFLDEIFLDDEDIDDKKQSLLEMIGYTLVMHTKRERFAILLGETSRNGKSVLLKVIQMIVGLENCAGVNPGEFTNNFQKAHLDKKLANIISEIKQGEKLPDNDLKQIVSGEIQTVEHKNKDPFSFEPFCTLWFGTNHLPYTHDYSPAIFERSIIYNFNRSFTRDQQDPNLVDKLKDEIPGIFRMAVQAYGKVIERGRILEPSSSIEQKKDWRKDINAISYFAEECLNPVFTNLVYYRTRYLYQLYQEFSFQKGISKLSEKKFSKRLKLLGYKSERKSEGTVFYVQIKDEWKSEMGWDDPSVHMKNRVRSL